MKRWMLVASHLFVFVIGCALSVIAAESVAPRFAFCRRDHEAAMVEIARAALDGKPAPQAVSGTTPVEVWRIGDERSGVSLTKVRSDEQNCESLVLLHWDNGENAREIRGVWITSDDIARADYQLAARRSTGADGTVTVETIPGQGQIRQYTDIDGAWPGSGGE